jgi:hypothetical protein
MYWYKNIFIFGFILTIFPPYTFSIETLPFPETNETEVNNQLSPCQEKAEQFSYPVMVEVYQPRAIYSQPCTTSDYLGPLDINFNAYGGTRYGQCINGNSGWFYTIDGPEPGYIHSAGTNYPLVGCLTRP